MSTQLVCEGEITTGLSFPECSTGWETSTSDTESLAFLTEQLVAINDFSLTTVSSMIAYYLLIFSLGFIAGTVARILKKA
jgi:hypothetical protein